MMLLLQHQTKAALFVFIPVSTLLGPAWLLGCAHITQERLTMLPFLLSFVDYDSSPEVYAR